MCHLVLSSWQWSFYYVAGLKCSLVEGNIALHSCGTEDVTSYNQRIKNYSLEYVKMSKISDDCKATDSAPLVVVVPFLCCVFDLAVHLAKQLNCIPLLLVPTRQRKSPQLSVSIHSHAPH